MDNSDISAFKPRCNARGNEEKDKIGRVRRRIVKIKDFLSASELSIPRLFTGGMIERIKEVAKENNISPIELLDNTELCKPITEQYNIKNAPNQLKYKYAEYLE